MFEFDGDKLKKLRSERKLRQRDLALILGKKTADVSNYENGHAAPRVDTLFDLADFFQLEPKDLYKKTEATV